jgi:hypothetical protein
MNRKATFAKRQREQDLKEHARAKNERKLARQGQVREVKGPQIAWDEAVQYSPTPDDPQPAPVSEVPTDDAPTSHSKDD